MTPLKLREEGYQVLVENLGQADAIRFLQQARWGRGDDTQERSERLNATTRKEFWQNLQKIRDELQLEVKSESD
ncbi:hypothetical protein LEP3755_67130 (plasmid) [Leptolyngbya sp. NIES-3755]|nr:hypothetical protein LEP3755_67130 [Leptolyngbya sp. NIES-3755]